MANSFNQFASNLVTQGANKAVSSITFESNLTPPQTIAPFQLGEPGSPPPPSTFSWLGFLQPKLTINTLAGPIIAAPAGEPNPYGWMIAASVVGLAIVGTIAAVSVISRRLR